MKWNKFTLKTRSEVEDIVISTLADVGIEGVEIQDKQPLTESDKQQMFVDIMPDIPDDDGIAYLNFYLDVDEDKEKVLADVRAALAEMQELDRKSTRLNSSQGEGSCRCPRGTCRNAGVPGPWRVHHHRV